MIWLLLLGVWVAGTVLGCFFFRAKTVCDSFTKYPVVAGSAPSREWQEWYSSSDRWRHREPTKTMEKVDDIHLVDREKWLADNDLGGAYLACTFWPIALPILALIALVAGVFWMFEWLTFNAGKACSLKKAKEGKCSL